MLDDKNIEKRINPFFESYNTPHNTVPFHRIKLEDYEEAFMEGIPVSYTHLTLPTILLV